MVYNNNGKKYFINVLNGWVKNYEKKWGLETYQRSISGSWIKIFLIY